MKSLPRTLALAALAAGTMFGADAPAANAPRALPAGFEPVGGTKLDPDGWPLEIRCVKDGAVMVFVPAGTTATGLTPEQLTALAKIDLVLKGDNFKGEDPFEVKRGLVFGLRCREWEQQQKEKEKAHPKPPPEKPRPILDLIRGFRRLRDMGKAMDEFVRKVEQEATPLTDDEIRTLDIEPLVVTWVLRHMERMKREIPADDLARWEKGGRKLKDLAEIPAVKESLGPDFWAPDSGPEGLLHQYDWRTDPDVRVRHTVEGFKEYFGDRAQVALRPFYIDKFEVTNAQYRRFMDEVKVRKHLPGIMTGPSYNIGAKPTRLWELWSDPKRNKDRQPVTCVSLDDANAYARWAGKSVPLRIEWQRAATGDGGRIFPWGESFDGSFCNSGLGHKPEAEAEMTLKSIVELVRSLKDALDGPPPAEVGSFPKDVSPFGCVDMAGNVSEWVRVAGEEDSFSGGNAGSLFLTDLVPARTGRLFGKDYRLIGFRNVLNLPAPKEAPPQ